MKNTFLTLLASASVAVAGPMDLGPAPADNGPAPVSGGLFETFWVGASVGYLHESEEEMWHFQLGMDLQPQLAGMDQSVFLEFGYNELEFFNVEQEIFPITVNYKLERPIFGPVNRLQDSSPFSAVRPLPEKALCSQL